MRGFRFFAFENRQRTNDEGQSAFQFHFSRKRSCIENEQDRSKDWFLWNTKRDGSWLWCKAVDADGLNATCKVGWKPLKGGRTLYSEIIMKSVEYGMVYCVKRCLGQNAYPLNFSFVRHIRAMTEWSKETTSVLLRSNPRWQFSSDKCCPPPK